MSEPLRLAIVGATGLIGQQVIETCIGREDVRLCGIARREVKLPRGIRMELFVAEPDKWGEVIEALKPKALICALGTTWKKSGEDEQAFRAVDQELVLATARAAKEHGVERFVAISSIGADPMSKNFYLRVKGEVERELTKIRFNRLDIIRPGLLRGSRDNDIRPAEKAGIVAAPLMNMMLHGEKRKFRAVKAETVAEAAIALAKKAARGRFVHEYDAIMRAAKSLPRIEA